MSSVRIKRGTRAQIEAAKAASQLKQGESYLITDEGRVAVGTAVNAYSAFLKEGEGGSGGGEYSQLFIYGGSAGRTGTEIECGSASAGSTATIIDCEDAYK
jgi:hypothetical protein